TLTRSGVFTEEFLQSLNIAEETGQIPEVMERQEKNYREEAARRLSALTRSASFGVWMIVAIFIIIAIFRIASIYFNALGSIG
ncbi:MAG TPA: type II secretion system F family protein, partial [Gemmataceae bacterium]